MMSTRRSYFTTGVLLSALVLFGSTAAQAQAPTNPDTVAANATGYTSVRVTWGPATVENTTGWQVGYAAHATATAFSADLPPTMTSVGMSDRRADLTGLMPGTRYIVGVRSVNADADPDEMSNWVMAGTSPTTDAVPAVDKVMDLRLEAGDGMIMAMWDNVSDDLGVHHYKVNITAAGGFSLEMGTGSDDNEYTIMNLTNGTEYTVKVAAVGMNPDGSADMDGDGTPERLGPFSDTKKATPMAGDGMDDEEMMETPALPLVGLLLLGAGLVAAGRRRLQQ